MIRKTYTRRAGSRFSLAIEVDADRLADDIARKASSSGKARLTRAGGAIVARVTELDR